MSLYPARRTGVLADPAGGSWLPGLLVRRAAAVVRQFRASWKLLQGLVNRGPGEGPGRSATSLIPIGHGVPSSEDGPRAFPTKTPEGVWPRTWGVRVAWQVFTPCAHGRL